MIYVLIFGLIGLAIPSEILSMDDKRICLKIDDNSIFKMSLNIAQESATIFKKYLWQERLSIDPVLPVVVQNVSLDELVLFTRALRCKKSQFESFYFDKLSLGDQKMLVSVAGKTKLNSSSLTARLLPLCLHKEIIAQHIVPHFDKDKKEIERYLRNAMVQINMSFRSSSEVWSPPGSYENCYMYHINGFVSDIPQSFATCPELYTANVSGALLPINQTTTIQAWQEHSACVKTYSPDKHFVTWLAKKVNNCEYRVTAVKSLVNQGDTLPDRCLLWRIKNEADGYGYTVINKQLEFPGMPIESLLCSPNGSHIALSVNGLDNNLILISLDHESPSTITRDEHLLDTSHHLVTRTLFNHNSSVLAATLYDSDNDACKLVLWDMEGKVVFCNSASGMYSSIAFNNDDSRMIATQITLNSSWLYIWDITNINEPIECFKQELSLIMIPDDIWWSPHADIAVVQLEKGGILLIEQMSNNDYKVQFLHETGSEEALIHYCRGAVLFSSDKNFIINNVNYRKIDEDEPSYYSPEYFEQRSLVYVWDINSKKLVCKALSAADVHKYKPEIALSCDGSSLFTNCGDSRDGLWLKHTLYSPDEHATLEWIDQCSDIGILYALRRMYYAHKENQELCDCAVGSSIVESISEAPQNVRECLLNYLLIKKKMGLLDRAHAFFSSWFS